MQNLDIIGLGVCTVDALTLVEDLPEPGRVTRGHEAVLMGGGPVATAMAAAARLGGKTAMVDRIGQDFLGDFIMHDLKKHGVDTSLIIREKNATSSLASIMVRKEDGERAIVYTPGNCGEFPPEMITPALLPRATILHVNGRHWAACLEACALAKKMGMLVSMDGGAHRFYKEHRQLLPMVDIAIVAREYAEQYAGTADQDQAAQALLAAGPCLVVITDGAGGSRVYATPPWDDARPAPSTGQQISIPSVEPKASHQPAYALESVKDTTGCGDVYHGAFLMGLAKGMKLRRCAMLASAAAAMNATHLGGRGYLPTLEEVEVFLWERQG